MRKGSNNMSTRREVLGALGASAVGMTFGAQPVRTILRGETIAIGGKAVGVPRGRLLTPAVPALV